MSPQTEFEATINSLGHCLVGYIGKDFIESLSVVGNEDTLDASAVIVPIRHEPQIYDKIIDAVIDVRGMFMNDVHFEYLIAGSDDSGHTAASSRAVFAMA